MVSYNRENLKSHSGERLPLLARCVCGFITACCNYYSIKLISLGDASTIAFSSPVFVSIFACLCLQEPCGTIQVITALMTVMGVTLICKPPFIFGGDSSHFSMVWMAGVLVALAGSLTRAINVICLRRIQRTPSSVVIFYFSSAGIVQSLLVLLAIQDLKFPNNTKDILLLLGLGAFTSLGQYFQTVALKIEQAGPVSMARTLDIVMSFVYQITLLNTPALWTDLVGAGIVCLSVIIVGIHKWYLKRPDLFNSCLPCLAPTKQIKQERNYLNQNNLSVHQCEKCCNHEIMKQAIRNGLNGISQSP